jgi:hypothetical protein
MRIYNMIKKEMIDNFGIDRKTLNNWENNRGSKRYILYRTLEAIPVEFVEKVKRREEEKLEGEKLLEGFGGEE